MSTPSLSPRVLRFLAVWWLLWTGIQSYLLNTQAIDWPNAIRDAIITQLTIALAGYAIHNSLRSYHPGARSAFYVLIQSVALAAICVGLQRWLVLYIVGDPVTYAKVLDTTLVIRGLFAWLMIMIISLLTWFWVYISERGEMEKRNEDSRKLAREAELSNLRMQMQPHFLFNSLNSISALIVSQPEQARLMIQQLADFLRGTIKRDERQLISLEEELRHLGLYLDIEKVRFGHRLQTRIENDEASLKCKLPSLLLQPVVENAIKFGLYDTVGEITISIHAMADNNQLRLEIRNPYDPDTAVSRPGTGFGLDSMPPALSDIFSGRLVAHETGRKYIYHHHYCSPNRMINVIIIDDEPLARTILKEYLQSYPNIEVVAECGDGFEGVKAITQHKPNLIFLDIQMPKINGFEMLELIDNPPAVIFTTAFDEYAIKAFESHAVDYLLKPFGKDRFDKALGKWINHPGTAAKEAWIEKVNQPEESQRIVVKKGSNIVIIPVEKVHYLEAYDDYVKIHTADGFHLKKKTMSHYEEVLNAAQFVRVHRSFMINLRELTRIEPLEKDNHVALLKSGARVPLSQSGYGRLKTILGI